MEDRYILLVEDDPDDLELTMLALRQADIPAAVVVARDGRLALDHLASHDPPSLAIIDLKLPKLDGVQVLQQIRANPDTHDMPVIIITSSTCPEDLDRIRSAGATAYIRKHVALRHFTEALTSLDVLRCNHNGTVATTMIAQPSAP